MRWKNLKTKKGTIEQSNSTSKYKNKKTIIDGIKFDSKAEGEYYEFLRDNKQYEIIELQPKIYLTEARILYKPDFLVEKNGEQYYIDVKGVRTSVFNLKCRLWKKYGAGDLHLVKKKYKRFETVEIVEVKK